MRNPEAAAIQVLLGAATEATLDEAARRIDQVVEQYGTLTQAAKQLGVSSNTLGKWRKIARRQALPPRSSPTPAGREVIEAVASNDRMRARIVLDEALARGLEAARYHLGVSQRTLKGWMDFAGVEVPRGRRTPTGQAEDIRVRLYSPVPGVSERAIEDLEDLAHEEGSLKGASARLGISYRTMLTWRDRFGIKPERAAERHSLEDEDTEIIEGRRPAPGPRRA